MRRLLAVFAFLGVGAAAGFGVKTLVEPGPYPLRASGWGGGDALRLSADARAVPVGAPEVIAGGRVRYAFRVVNAGHHTLRHVAARSEQVDRAGAGPLTVESVSDPACWGGARVDCLFTRLDPGEWRTVRVTARTPRTGHSGDRIVMNTFLGRFARSAGGGVDLDVMVGVQRTSASIAGPPRYPAD